jgi:methyl-accepting chemotaxis protein
MLLSVLILFFIILIVYQIFLAYFQHPKIIEGMLDVVPTLSPQFIPTSSPTNEMLPNLNFTQIYKQYDKEISHNTFLMAQQNAGNIEYLKQRIDAVQNMYQQVRDLSANVTSLSTQVNGLVQSQQQYATQVSGGTPPTVTGTD